MFTADAFAPLGLRALHFLVSGLLDRLVRLSTGLLPVVIAAVPVVTTLAGIIRSRRDPAARTHAGFLRERRRGPDGKR